MLAAALAVPAAFASAGTAAPAPASAGRHVVRACARPAAGEAACDALVLVGASGTAALSPDAAQTGYGPADLQSAYALTGAATANGTGETIAIVDAYDDPTAASDLATYRANYALPACTTASHCLTIEGQTGGKTPKTDPTGGWELEESLDLDMASAICPNCHLLLVEAKSASYANLGTAENTAAKAAGVRVVSNSFGGGESAKVAGYDKKYFTHPGVAVVASAGDDGYGVEYPASSPSVTAVGGTSLAQTGSGRGWAETVWGSGAGSATAGGTGSGCSAREAKPSWQHDSGCAKRTVTDVSADADPNTGAAVYDTTPYEVSQGKYETLNWVEVGGTSESAPIIAGVYALGTSLASGTWTSNLYSHTANLNDVTSGSNGSCPTATAYLCTGETGYDGPTGLGTPSGVGAF